MKNLDFLKSNLISYQGIYDNERIFENTLQSYARANKFGYLIHVDVKMTACGTLICFHDDNLERMLHVDQKVSEITYDELCYISKYQIPKFEDVLELIRGSVPLVVNLDVSMKNYLAEKSISTFLDEYEGDVAIVSKSRKTLKWFYKNRANYVVGLVLNHTNYLKSLFFKRCDFFYMDVKLYNHKYVRKLRESRFIIGYLIKDKDEYVKMNGAYDNFVVDNMLEIIE